MAQRIITGLEFIKVNQQYITLRLVSLGTVQRGLQSLLQYHAIAKACQGVVTRLLCKLLFLFV